MTHIQGNKTTKLYKVKYIYAFIITSYTVAQKLTQFLYALTLPNIN